MISSSNTVDYVITSATRNILDNINRMSLVNNTVDDALKKGIKSITSKVEETKFNQSQLESNSSIQSKLDNIPDQIYSVSKPAQTSSDGVNTKPLPAHVAAALSLHQKNDKSNQRKLKTEQSVSSIATRSTSAFSKIRSRSGVEL